MRLIFFKSALSGGFASAKDLFYELNGKSLAYAPKSIKKTIVTLQSKNSLMGSYTEIWCEKLLAPLARELGLYAVRGVICKELGMVRNAKMDLGFCTSEDKIQRVENIKMIFEIKMSITNNYELKNGKVEFVGDHTTHRGSPSLLRSDSVLKAAGKAINTRLSCEDAKKIPIVILGNTHISDYYLDKADNLAQYGVVQKIISLNPHTGDTKSSPLNHFCTPQNSKELKEILKGILKQKLYYFSAMISKEKLGQAIKKISKTDDEIELAENFLNELKKAYQ